MNNTKSQKIEVMDMMREFGLKVLDETARKYPEGFEQFLLIAKQSTERAKLIPESVGIIALMMSNGASFQDCLNAIEKNFTRIGI